MPSTSSQTHDARRSLLFDDEPMASSPLTGNITKLSNYLLSGFSEEEPLQFRKKNPQLANVARNVYNF